MGIYQCLVCGFKNKNAKNLMKHIENCHFGKRDLFIFARQIFYQIFLSY